MDLNTVLLWYQILQGKGEVKQQFREKRKMGDQTKTETLWKRKIGEQECAM